MFDRGLVIGKFYPPTKGHSYLIDTARAACRQVILILAYRTSETISPWLRAEWLSRLFPDVAVKAVEVPQGLADTDSAGWAAFTREILSGTPPNAVFTSENYGEAYARHLGAVHVMVDHDRITVPISATEVRANPLGQARYLEPCVRSHFARRIAIVGAESSGKTTLAQALAQHYGTAWVPEYGRLYTEGKYTGDRTWRSDEFTLIADGQMRLEDQLAESCNGLLICDTDVLATYLWHRRYMGFDSPTLERAARKRHYDLYLLAGTEIPWVQDGTRDGQDIRDGMQREFLQALKRHDRRYVEIEGPQATRLAAAITAIDGVLADAGGGGVT